MKERIIIGTGTCADCGSAVELRVSQGGKVYYRCDGTLAPGCSASHTSGNGTSRRLIKEAGGGKAAPAAAPKPAPAPAKPKVRVPTPEELARTAKPPEPPKAPAANGWGVTW